MSRWHHVEAAVSWELGAEGHRAGGDCTGRAGAREGLGGVHLESHGVALAGGAMPRPPADARTGCLPLAGMRLGFRCLSGSHELCLEGSSLQSLRLTEPRNSIP